MKGLLTPFFILSISLLSSPALFAAETIGQVVWVKGTLKAAQTDQAARTLTRRSPIFVQDTLTTDASSTGQVVFTDSSVLALRANTSLVLSQYKLGKGAAAKESTFVANIAKGGFRTITGAVAKENPDGYQANTPVATIGVAGTGFDIYYDPNIKKLSVNCQIQVCIVSNSLGKQVLNKDTPYAVVEHDQAPKTVKTLPPELATGSPVLQKADFQPNAVPAADIGPGSGPGSGTGTTGTGGKDGVKELKALNMPCP